MFVVFGGAFESALRGFLGIVLLEKFIGCIPILIQGLFSLIANIWLTSRD